MTVCGTSESLIFTVIFVKRIVNGTWLYSSVFESFYILAAQFIYSRRDSPSVGEPVEEYDYEDLKEPSSALLNRQLSGVDQGIENILYLCFLRMTSN